MLTDKQIRELRQRRAKGESINALAAHYGCAKQTASDIAVGNKRREAGGPISEPASPHTGTKVTKIIAKRIAQMRANGKTMRQISAAIGISPAAVCKAIARQTRSTS